MDNTYDKLSRFCMYRERCIFEVKQKMYELEVKEEDQEKFIKQLQEERFLDEERYIKSYINSKIYIKKWGRKKIMAELSIRKLDKKRVQHYMMESDDEVYIQNLTHLAEKKWATLYKKEPREKKASLIRYMLGKGYEMDLVMDWLKTAPK